MVNPDQNLEWYLAQCKPNSHNIAIRNLERQKFQTFLPLHTITRRRAGQFVSVLQPLFAGYFFIAFNPSLPGWRAINSTHGVSRLVSAGHTPQIVPLELIAELKLRCDHDGQLKPMPPPFQKGNSVRVTYGPFVDFVATVETMDPDQRVWVLLDLMGQSTRMAVPADILEQIT